MGEGQLDAIGGWRKRDWEAIWAPGKIPLECVSGIPYASLTDEIHRFQATTTEPRHTVSVSEITCCDTLPG